MISSGINYYSDFDSDNIGYYPHLIFLGFFFEYAIASLPTSMFNRLLSPHLVVVVMLGKHR